MKKSVSFPHRSAYLRLIALWVLRAFSPGLGRSRIESFPGILIASTNLIDDLDQASLRRFDLKLHFDYLQPGQTQRLFAAHCHKLEFDKPTEREIAAAADLEAATPGDFAAVVRRHNFQPVHSPDDLLEKLREEIQHKLPGLRRIGFCQ